MKVEDPVSPHANLVSITKGFEKSLSDKCCSNVPILLFHEPIPKIYEQHTQDWSCVSAAHCCSMAMKDQSGLLTGITHLWSFILNNI